MCHICCEINLSGSIKKYAWKVVFDITELSCRFYFNFIFWCVCCFFLRTSHMVTACFSECCNFKRENRAIFPTFCVTRFQLVFYLYFRILIKNFKICIYRFTIYTKFRQTNRAISIPHFKILFSLEDCCGG
jgi:hypothetical protein